MLLLNKRSGETHVRLLESVRKGSGDDDGEAEEALVEEVGKEVPSPPPAQVPEAVGKPARGQILLAASGIVGPVLYTIVWAVLGSIQPGYDHVAQAISELGAVGAPNALIMNAVGFVPSGLLIVAFALGLHRGIGGGRRPKAGPALLALVGAGLAAAGSPADIADFQAFTSIVHILASFLVFFVGAWLAPLVIAQRLKEDVRWQGYRRYSLATGALLLGLLGFPLLGFTVLPVLVQVGGLWQRLFLGILFLWIVVMAVRVLRLSVRPSTEGTR